MSQDPRRPGRPWPPGASIVLPDRPEASDDGAGVTTPVFDQLRRAILFGDVEPGGWLRQTELAENFQVSRTPVREALRALEREGLVRIVPNHGAQVAPLSLEAFEEIYALRAGVEGLAARKAAEAASDEDKSSLRDRLDQLRDIAHAHSLRTYLRSEWELRVVCYELTRRSRLVATIRHLRESAERYLRLAYQVDDDTRESLAFHETLVNEIVRGDGDAAERTNRSALRWTLERAWPVVSARVTCEAEGTDGPGESAKQR